ncbi:MAG: hypothetical protein K2F85_01740 [Helicobacter sp.]|nr:hypothetical protein [Helicobacter sp.]
MNMDITHQLIVRGHDKAKIKELHHDQLQEIFDKETRERIVNFDTLLQQEGLAQPNDDILKSNVHTMSLKDYWRKIEQNRDDSKLIYELLGEMVREYPASEIMEFFAFVSSGSLFKSLEGMLQLKNCEYQEILLDMIEDFYKNLPPEELEFQMEHYTNVRNDVARLEFVVRVLKRQNKELISMACLKDLIRQEFFKEDE